jgi:hypothetical protein
MFDLRTTEAKKISPTYLFDTVIQECLDLFLNAFLSVEKRNKLDGGGAPNRLMIVQNEEANKHY